jgi:hypothetical protein
MRIVIESDDGALAIDRTPAAARPEPPRYGSVAARGGGAAPRSGASSARPQLAGAGAINGGRAPSRRFLERRGQLARIGQAVDAGPPPPHLVARTDARTARATRSRRGRSHERG